MAGRVLDLKARGDIGTAGDVAYAQLGYDANLFVGAEICSGLRVGFAAGLRGRGAAGVEIAEFLEVAAEVEIGAELRAEIVAQASPDVTKTFGLQISAAVQAKAFVRARVAGELLLGQIVADAIAEDGSVGLEERLLLALVDQISLEFGVEVSFELAISAAAIVAARLNLRPAPGEEPGFDIRVGAGAGFLYGKDIAFFLRGRLPSLDLYLDQAIGIVGDEIGQRADGPAGRILADALTAAGRCMVLVLTSDDPGVPAQAADVLERLVRDAFVTALEAAIRAAIDAALSAAVPGAGALPAGFADRASGMVRDGTDDLAGVLGLLADLAETMPAATPEPPLSRVSAVLHAVFFVLSPADPAFDPALPPHVVRQAGLAAGRDRFANAAEAMAVVDNGQLAAMVRSLPAPLDALADAVLTRIAANGIGIGAFLTSAPLDGATTRAIVAALFEQSVIPQMDAVLARADVPPALAPLLQSMLHGMGKVLLPMLVDIAAEPDAKRRNILQRRLGDAAARIAATLIVGQVATIARNTLDSSVARFDDRIEQARALVAVQGSEFAERIVDPMLGVLSDALPGIDLRRTPRRAALLRITVSMTQELLDAAQEAFGAQTWTPARTRRISDTVVRLTTGIKGGRIDWAGTPSPDLRLIFDALNDCPPLLREAKDDLDLLGDDLMDIGLAQAKVFLLRVPGILARHLPDLASETFLAILEEGLAYLADRIRTFLDRQKEELRELAERLALLAAEIAAAAAVAVAAIEALRRATIAWVEGRIDGIIAALDFDGVGFVRTVGDAILTFLGVPDAIEDDDDKAEAARTQLRRLKGVLRDRLDDAAFAPLRDAVQTSRHGASADVGGVLGGIVGGLMTRKERDALAALPLVSGASAAIDSTTLNRAVQTAITDLGTRVETLDTLKLQQSSGEERRASLQKDVDAVLARRESSLRAMRHAPGIRFNSPLSVDPVPDDSARPPDLPVYGRFVQLEIDFGAFDLDLLGDLPDLSFAAMARDGNGNAQSGAEAVERYLGAGFARTGDLAPLDLRLFVNGTEIALTDLHREGNRLSGTLPEALLKPGTNHALLSITPAPSLGAGPPVLHHVAFIRDARRMDRPSNVVTIDPVLSVIDTAGDDHNDARGRSQSDREVVVLRNQTADRIFSLLDWTLEDAHGHLFRIGPSKLPAGATFRIVVGRPSGRAGDQFWTVDYGYGPIALFNNTGECLLLRDPTGRIVSQLFSGAPASNPDILMLTERAER